MIELKNVCKIYKSKKGKNTKALDDVSLTFGDKGMTFILGKSGSGKSTLLNILGGLDKYDTGDMLILGKSSKDFTQADFDSYRNTYVGFIFQEFNLLEDYDVYQNIVLALQLQQKEVHEKEIEELLNRLELTDLKKRKVNELSGGQKQRVAIARALIKEPKIILADEPTGNLDSKTGIQVMELLKEISKDTLVVVVSHDEEYATKYGDRIIEIKDGKVIRDSNALENQGQVNEYKTIKSHLPFKDSFKLGFGSLKHKKVKLVFTILLIIATLGFLSCADTLSSYDFSVSHAKVLSDNEEQFVQVVEKEKLTGLDGSVYMMDVPLCDDGALSIREQMNQDGYEVYTYYGTSNSGSITDTLHIQNSDWYTTYDIVVTSNISDILKENLIGRNAINSNEIVISNYVANLMMEHGVEVNQVVYEDEFRESYIFTPTSYEEILNTNYTYYFGDLEGFKIVGIIDYDLSNVSNYYINYVLSKVFVASSFIERYSGTLDTINNRYRTDLYVDALMVDTEKEDGTNVNGWYPVSVLNQEVEYFDGVSWQRTSRLNDNEVILSMSQVIGDDSMYYEDLNNYISSSMGDETLRRNFIANYINEKGVIGSKVNLTFRYGYDGIAVEEFSDLVVVGVYYQLTCPEDEYCSYDASFFSEDILGEYMQQRLERTGLLYPMTEEEDFRRVSDMFPTSSTLSVQSTYSEVLGLEGASLSIMKTLASYAGLIFGVFTIFLIINFMFTSITYRKKEIGVLRALGSRSSDVCKIFLWEAFTLSIISGTIASILLVIVSNFVNTYIMTRLSMLTTPFLVGIRQFVVIYVMVFAVTIIASILPIIRISKMKPIDAILNK